MGSVLGCGFISSHLELGGSETLLGLLPVDDLPHLFEVLGARVLVVKVVGVLPDVNVHDRDKVRAHIRDQVLVDGGTEVEGLLSLVVDEPAPAGALNGGGACVEDADELLHATPALDDSVVKGARLGESAVGLWAERVPEELVVQVTTTVEADLVRQGDRLLKIAGCTEFSLLLEEIVEVVHIRAMVLAVMEVKEEAAHDGLERSNLKG